MAAGKTTVGREVARRLGWDFVDLDQEIERRTGTAVAELFRHPGEAGFRELEAEAARSVLEGTEVVLAPGGGWAARPGRLDELPEGTLSVWLRVDPEVAVSRARAEGDIRPLLSVSDPEETARALLADREPLYARARLHLDATGTSPDALAAAIVEAVGRPLHPS